MRQFAFTVFLRETFSKKMSPQEPVDGINTDTRQNLQTPCITSARYRHFVPSSHWDNFNTCENQVKLKNGLYFSISYDVVYNARLELKKTDKRLYVPYAK